MIENYFELLKSCSAQPFSAEMTVLVCEPIIHAVAYCENKAFFKQSSEALIQGLLPGADDDAEEAEEDEEEEVDCDEESGSDEDIDSEIDAEEDDEIESENESSEMEEISGDEVEFDSEDFDNIKDDCHDHDSECGEHCEDEEMMEEEPFIFDYSLLSKSIFDFGAREDVLVRNRRFLYELSQIIEEVANGTFESSCCDEGESCCAENDSCCN